MTTMVFELTVCVPVNQLLVLVLSSQASSAQSLYVLHIALCVSLLLMPVSHAFSTALKDPSTGHVGF